SLCTATLTKGTGSCKSSNAPVGTDTIVGNYSGNSGNPGHAASSGTTTLVVNAKSSSGTWTLTLSDPTQGWSFTKVLNYKGAGSSAEWILEAPTVNGQVATLANYGSTTFDLGTIDGSESPQLTASDAGEMLNPSNAVISIPSLPNPEEDGFAVAYGSVAPAAPSS
ncbi:MAG: G1 family glutamic endopeptidase, partial [Nitrososphaerales archaeon]